MGSHKGKVGTMTGCEEGGTCGVGTRVFADERVGGSKVLVHCITTGEDREGSRGREKRCPGAKGGQEDIGEVWRVASRFYNWNTEGGRGRDVGANSSWDDRDRTYRTAVVEEVYTNIMYNMNDGALG